MQQKANLVSPVNATALRASEDPNDCTLSVRFQVGPSKPFKLHLDHGKHQRFDVSVDDGPDTFTGIKITMDVQPDWSWHMDASHATGEGAFAGISWNVWFDVMNDALGSTFVRVRIENKNQTSGTITLSVTCETASGGGFDPQIVLPPQG